MPCHYSLLTSFLFSLIPSPLKVFYEPTEFMHDLLVKNTRLSAPAKTTELYGRCKWATWSCAPFSGRLTR